MRCYINYNPDQPIPISRTTNRAVYEETPYITPSELLKYKTRLINADRTMSQTARYSYLINNPIKTYGTQSDKYTNPNTLEIERIGATYISVNNNPTCQFEYPISNPSAFPSYQPSVIYPTHPVVQTNPPPCINYTALAGGFLSRRYSSCVSKAMTYQ